MLHNPSVSSPDKASEDTPLMQTSPERPSDSTTDPLESSDDGIRNSFAVGAISRGSVDANSPSPQSIATSDDEERQVDSRLLARPQSSSSTNSSRASLRQRSLVRSSLEYNEQTDLILRPSLLTDEELKQQQDKAAHKMRVSISQFSSTNFKPFSPHTLNSKKNRISTRDVDDEFYKFKVVMLGSSTVGKSSMVVRFAQGKFAENYQATLGIDFISTSIVLPVGTTRLQLWDTAGQERFKSLVPGYVRGAQVAVIVYDVTNRTTFDSLDTWCSLMQNEGNPNACMYVVGNKCDLEHERQVTKKEGQALAEQFGAMFAECSAKEDINVHYVFRDAAEKAVELLEQGRGSLDKVRVDLDRTMKQNDRTSLIDLEAQPWSLWNTLTSDCC